MSRSPDMTGAGMMDAKGALDEADGNPTARSTSCAPRAPELPSAGPTRGVRPVAQPAARWSRSTARLTRAKNDDFVAAGTHRRRGDRPPPATPVPKAVALDGKTIGEVVEGLATTIGEDRGLGRSPTSRRR
jgi:elongation factor Ts